MLLSLVTHAAAATAESFQSCPTLCDPIDGSPPGSSVCPWDSLGKNTGMGCHFLLQVTHERWKMDIFYMFVCLFVFNALGVLNVHYINCAQLLGSVWHFATLWTAGSSIHGIFQARILERVVVSSSRGFSQPSNLTHVSCMAGGFFTTEALRKPCYTNHLYNKIYIFLRKNMNFV